MAYDSNAAELLTSLRKALEERDRLRVHVARLKTFGQQLANCAYNIKQQAKMSAREKSCLNAAQEGWDKALREFEKAKGTAK